MQNRSIIETREDLSAMAEYTLHQHPTLDQYEGLEQGNWKASKGVAFSMMYRPTN